MVTTAGRAARIGGCSPASGHHCWRDEIGGDILEAHGFTALRTNNFGGTLQWSAGQTRDERGASRSPAFVDLSTPTPELRCATRQRDRQPADRGCASVRLN